VVNGTGYCELSSYYGNKVHSVSVIVVNDLELEPCRENLNSTNLIRDLEYHIQAGSFRLRIFSTPLCNMLCFYEKLSEYVPI
jgi:hypothetical protein